MFSKACEYGIRATLFVAEQSAKGKRTGVKEIAKQTDSPEAFTAKILQTLVKSQVLASVKGPSGGFEIDKASLDKITLMHLVKAIDGDNIYNGCGLGLKECNAKRPCPVHDHFVSIRDDLKKMLSITTLSQLIENLENGHTVLKR